MGEEKPDQLDQVNPYRSPREVAETDVEAIQSTPIWPMLLMAFVLDTVLFWFVLCVNHFHLHSQLIEPLHGFAISLGAKGLLVFAAVFACIPSGLYFCLLMLSRLYATAPVQTRIHAILSWTIGAVSSVGSVFLQYFLTK